MIVIVAFVVFFTIADLNAGLDHEFCPATPASIHLPSALDGTPYDDNETLNVAELYVFEFSATESPDGAVIPLGIYPEHE